jgi:hypothetical protein
MGKERSIFVGFDEGSTNEPFVHPYRDLRAHMVTHLGKVMHRPDDLTVLIYT